MPRQGKRQGKCPYSPVRAMVKLRSETVCSMLVYPDILSPSFCVHSMSGNNPAYPSVQMCCKQHKQR